MPDAKKPSITIKPFNDLAKRKLGDHIAATAGTQPAIQLPPDYSPPTLRSVSLSPEENRLMNDAFGDAMRNKLGGLPPNAMGPIAVAVVSSVAGAVASTIVDKKLSSATVLPDDFRIDVVDGE